MVVEESSVEENVKAEQQPLVCALTRMSVSRSNVVEVLEVLTAYLSWSKPLTKHKKLKTDGLLEKNREDHS